MEKKVQIKEQDTLDEERTGVNITAKVADKWIRENSPPTVTIKIRNNIRHRIRHQGSTSIFESNTTAHKSHKLRLIPQDVNRLRPGELFFLQLPDGKRTGLEPNEEKKQKFTVINHPSNTGELFPLGEYRFEAKYEPTVSMTKIEPFEWGFTLEVVED